jgi:hypothetical protein
MIRLGNILEIEERVDMDIKKKRSSHVNRYSDEIVVERISLTEFIMSGYSSDFYRTSVTDDNKLIMFDPPGGPYTTAKHGAQPGTDMGYYEEEWKGLVIESMEFVEAGIKLTCFYETKVDWIQIKEDEFDEEHALSEALNYMLRDIDIDELSDNKEINKK